MLLGGCQGGERSDGEQDLIQFGSMHETIGQQRHEARVELAEVIERPHFYGVGALEGLNGEISILDSRPIVTMGSGAAALRSIDPANARATLLIGQSVPAWTEQAVGKNVDSVDIDAAIRESALASGLDLSSPFAFVIEGDFKDVRLHVINGACPVHARIQKKEIPEEPKADRNRSGNDKRNRGGNLRGKQGWGVNASDHLSARSFDIQGPQFRRASDRAFGAIRRGWWLHS